MVKKVEEYGGDCLELFGGYIMKRFVQRMWNAQDC